jgi:Homeodomain-like domain
MIKVELAKWRQTVEDLRLASLNETHPRTRERFQALYLIASGQFHATACAAHIGRQDETVLRWVHLYNRYGPDGLTYRHTGGPSPLLLSSR